MATFAAALVFAVIGIVLAFGAFVVIWKDGISGAGLAFSAIAIGAALIAYPAYLGVRAYNLPMINDITTDPINPPRFEMLSRRIIFSKRQFNLRQSAVRRNVCWIDCQSGSILGNCQSQINLR